MVFFDSGTRKKLTNNNLLILNSLALNASYVWEILSGSSSLEFAMEVADGVQVKFYFTKDLDISC